MATLRPPSPSLFVVSRVFFVTNMATGVAETPPGDQQQLVATLRHNSSRARTALFDSLSYIIALRGAGGTVCLWPPPLTMVTPAPCEGGVITGRPTRTFPPPTPLPLAWATYVVVGSSHGPISLWSRSYVGKSQSQRTP